MSSYTEKQIITILKGLFTIHVRASGQQNTEIELIHKRISALEDALICLVQMAADAQPVKNPDLTEVAAVLNGLKKVGHEINRENARASTQIEHLEAALQELIQPGDPSNNASERQSGTQEE